MNTSEALARLQAAAEYAARPPQPLAGARGSGRVPPMSDSYRKAVEQFQQWSDNFSAREEDLRMGVHLETGMNLEPVEVSKQ